MFMIKNGYLFVKCREIKSGYNGAHLIFTTNGDAFNDPNGCWAYIGRQGAQGGKAGQTVNLGATADGCFNPGTITHEILHSLLEKKGSLFSSFNTPYDFSSIMHYGAYDSSKSGKKTIIPLMDNVKIE